MFVLIITTWAKDVSAATLTAQEAIKGRSNDILVKPQNNGNIKPLQLQQKPICTCNQEVLKENMLVDMFWLIGCVIPCCIIPCEVVTLLVNRPAVHDRSCACGGDCDEKMKGFC